MRTLSYSSISRYDQCPLLYKLIYVDGLKGKPHLALSFGSSLHEALRYFYSVVPPPPTLEGLMSALEDSWVGDGYASKEEEQKYLKYGKELLEEFYDLNIEDYKIPIAVEHRYDVEISGYKVMGYVDRVDKLDNDRAEIVDYKTGVKIMSTAQVSRDQQLTFYQIGVEETLGIGVDKLTLYHLRSQTPVRSSARTEKEQKEIENLVQKVGRGIEAELFEPTKNNWCPCDFPQHCPHYMQEHFPEKKRVEITEVVEEYAALKNEEKEIKEKIAELSAEINRYCEEENIARVFGDKHMVSRNEISRGSYEENEIKGLLEPVGMWEKVLSFDSKLLKDLMEDDGVDEDLKEKIRALETIKKYHQLRYGKKKD